MSSAVLAVQQIIGTPVSVVYTDVGDGVQQAVAVYDLQYITCSILLLMTVWVIYKLIIKLTDSLTGRRTKI